MSAPTYEELEQRLARAEKAIAALQECLASEGSDGTTLLAPLRIVTADGRVLMEVDVLDKDVQQSHLRLFHAHGEGAASLGVDRDGGWLALRNAAGVLVAYLNVEMAGARLVLTDHHADGSVALFGGDSGEDSGGGINIMETSRRGHKGLSLWAGRDPRLKVMEEVSGEDAT